MRYEPCLGGLRRGEYSVTDDYGDAWWGEQVTKAAQVGFLSD